jgi:hypothetical protein
MKLCYRGIDYSITVPTQNAEWFVRSNLWISLTYRGRCYQLSSHFSNFYAPKALDSEKLAFQKLLTAKQRYQLTYRGVVYALAF